MAGGGASAAPRRTCVGIMADQDEQLIADPLFLACTRPAMLLGVPLEAMVVNLMLTGILFVGGNNMLFLLVAPVLHVIFRAICKHDHNAFRLIWMWIETKGRARNKRLWGGSSCSPIRVSRPSKAKDLARG